MIQQTKSPLIGKIKKRSIKLPEKAESLIALIKADLMDFADLSQLGSI